MENLIQLCGLSHMRSPVASPPIWLKATLWFLSRERYVLGTKTCELSLSRRSNGFGLVFKKPVMIQADALMGPHNEEVVLMDVEIHFAGDMPVLAMAALQPGRYPRVFRRGHRFHVD